MSTIANITVALTADVTGFVAGLEAGKTQMNSLMRAVAKSQAEALTPIQRYEEAASRLGAALASGKTGLTDYATALGFIQRARDVEIAAVNRHAAAVAAEASAVQVAAAQMQAAQAMSANPLTVPGANVFQRGDLAQQGASITSANLTAQERYAAQVALITELRDRAHITDTIYDRELAKQTQLLNDATGATARNAAEQERLNRLKTGGLSQAGQRTNLADAALANIGRLAQQAMTPAQYDVEVKRLNADLARLVITEQQHRVAVGNAATVMQRAQGEAKGMSGGMRMLLSSISPSLGQMAMFGTGIGAAIVGVNLLKDTISGIVGAAASATAEGIRLYATFDRAQTSFTTLFKSGDIAKKLLDDIKQFAAVTPMEFPELKDSAVKLAGFGIEAKQLLPTMRLLGDIAAGTGSNILELAETYGKARVQGRAYTRDVNEFANRGVAIWQAMAETTGQSIAEVHGAVETGKVGFAELQMALRSLAEEGGMFAGGMERASQDLMGLYSTLHDNVNLALASFGEHLTKDVGLKGLMQDAIPLTYALRDDLAPALSQIAKLFLEFGTMANNAGKMFLGADFSIKGMTDSIKGWHVAVLQADMTWARWTGNLGRAHADQQELFNIMARGISGPNTPALPGMPDIEKGGTGGAMEEYKALQADIGKVQEKLLEQWNELKYGKEAWEAYNLQQRGATDEQLAWNAAVQKDNAGMQAANKTKDEAAVGVKKLEQDSQSLVSSLEKQIATWGMSADEIARWELQQRGAEQGTLEYIKDLQDYAAGLKGVADAAKEAADEQEAFAKRGEQMIRDNMTPLEKYLETIEEIKDQLATENIDQETAMRAAEKAQKEFGGKEAEKHEPYMGENKPLLAGSSEAFTALNRAQYRRNDEKVAEQQLTVLQRMEILQRENNRILGGTETWRD